MNRSERSTLIPTSGPRSARRPTACSTTSSTTSPIFEFARLAPHARAGSPFVRRAVASRRAAPWTRFTSSSKIRSCRTQPATCIRASWAGSTGAGRCSVWWPRCWPPASIRTWAAAITPPSRSSEQVIRWFSDLFGFPATATGLLVTGTSIANFMAVVVARAAALGPEVRRAGVGGHRLVAYTSSAAHGCVLSCHGHGGDRHRCRANFSANSDHQIDVAALRDAVARDKAAQHQPFLVIGTAGTVDIGAIDDLTALAQSCREEGLWFHVDGAFGALGALSQRSGPPWPGSKRPTQSPSTFTSGGRSPTMRGASSCAMRKPHCAAFSTQAAYLRREARGLAAGRPWPCDLGPDLSRGFRALKVWYTIKVLGADRLGAAIEQTCVLARRLAERIDREPLLERLAPVPLNIVCFRYKFAEHLDRENAALAADLQESGITAPSTTSVAGCLALRAAIVNHRTRASDIDAFVEAVLELGRRRDSRAGR